MTRYLLFFSVISSFSFSMLPKPDYIQHEIADIILRCISHEKGHTCSIDVMPRNGFKIDEVTAILIDKHGGKGEVILVREK